MRYRNHCLVLMIALCVMLVGCHSAKIYIPPNFRSSGSTDDPLKAAKARLQDATPCCGSFADFSYQTLLPNHPKKFELGSDSMVANLNGVRSYFLSFQLPIEKKPYRVAMKSELNGRWLPSTYLFAPTVVLLDDAFQPLDSQDVKLCEYMGWSDSTTGAFGSIAISNAKARYLVIYSSATQQASQTYWEQSPASSADDPVKMASDGSFKIPHGPDGIFWIGMMSKPYEKAINNAVCGEAPKGNGLLNTLRTAIPVHWGGGGS